MNRPIALWVTPVSQTGGVARHVLDVARAGIPGFRVVVLCPEGPLAEDLRSGGLAVLTGPFGPGAGPDPVRAASRSGATLAHALRTLRPAVVHSHLAFADLVAAAVVRGLPVPGVRARGGHRILRGDRAPLLVSTEHGISADSALYHPRRARARAKAALHTLRLRYTDVCLAVSDATADAMRERWNAGDVVVVPNGVDRPDHLRGATAGNGTRYLSLARLSHEKGLPQVLRAFALLRETTPHACLTLAGEGPDRAALETLIVDLGLEDAVDVPGHVPSAEAMAEHDVVVQLSAWENCSYTLLDAAAAGLGVVATDVGGNGEILPPECLVDPRHPDQARRVARVMALQSVPARRPGLPAAWPSVAQATEHLARIYTEARS